MPFALISTLWYGVFCIPLTLILVPTLLIITWFRVMVVPARRKNLSRSTVVAVFHPHCSAGGGGERVLWKMIQVMGNLMTKGMPIRHVIIYTVDAPTLTFRTDLIQHVQDRFSLTFSTELLAALSFVHLHQHQSLLEPAGSFSLVRESIGAMRLAYKALSNVDSPLPDLLIDTTGCAFTYVPAVLLFGCRVLAYVHYPTISTDMLQLVWERRRSAYNHQAYIAASAVTTYLKLVYYLAFAVLYGAVGSLATLVLVNSTWTYHHIASLWKGAAWRRRIRIVFPPCSLADDSTPVVTSHPTRPPVIVSIGQFRPEKDHVLQLESLAQLVTRHPHLECTMVLIGSCRGASDEARLEQLRALCDTLHLSSRVQFVVNRPFADVLKWLDQASVGIHTMWNEHFGIGIVEMMAAGLIVIAHNSGGPRSDIVVPYHGTESVTTTRTGYLATTSADYADAMYKALTLDQTEATAIRRNAQESAKRFTDDVFAASFEQAMVELELK